jgi:hypothetical protein
LEFRGCLPEGPADLPDDQAGFLNRPVVELSGDLMQGWQLDRVLEVQALSFETVVPGTSGEVSNIIEGLLRFPDVADSVHLSRGDFLTLQSLSGRLTSLKVDDGVEAVFDGTAEGIFLGQSMNEDLSPSRLEYYIKHHTKYMAVVAFLLLRVLLGSLVGNGTGKQGAGGS